MSTPNRPLLPDPATAPELFEGVLQRRVAAFVIDLAILGCIALLVAFVGLIAGILTLGLAWLILPFALPVILLLYYVATLGSPARATIGMRMMDLVLTPARGAPLDGWKVLAHPILFWITAAIAWPVALAVALFTPRREMAHDLVAGTLLLRRSPMQRHWQGVPA